MKLQKIKKIIRNHTTRISEIPTTFRRFLQVPYHDIIDCRYYPSTSIFSQTTKLQDRILLPKCFIIKHKLLAEIHNSNIYPPYYYNNDQILILKLI